MKKRMKTIDNIQLTRKEDISLELLMLCEKVTAKRAKTVIDHILQHGYITNEDLSSTYGYDHPPRAIRDVRENGIPLITHRVVNDKTGRRIGAYTFGDVKKISKGRIGGRKAFSKNFKELLVEKYGSREAFSGDELEPRYLQIDHRIPYEIAGNDAALDNLDEFMLLDASSQRAKSWSCENCRNFKELRDPNICRECFWAFPESYSHVAMTPEIRLHIQWREDEVDSFKQLEQKAVGEGVSVQDYIKLLIRNWTQENRGS